MTNCTTFSTALTAQSTKREEGKVLSLLETCFDLITGSSLHVKSQIMGKFKIKAIYFCVKNLKMKRKKNKNFLSLWNGDLNPRFSVIFFMQSEEPEIKSKQVSKKIGLYNIYLSFYSTWGI